MGVGVVFLNNGLPAGEPLEDIPAFQKLEELDALEEKELASSRGSLTHT